MKRLCLAVIVLVLCLGCTREPTIPTADNATRQADSTETATPAVSPLIPEPDGSKKDRPNSAGGQPESTYLGKPIGYWVEQAQAANPTEDRGKTVAALTLALSSDELSEMVAAADALKQIGPDAKPAAEAMAAKLDHVQPWIRTACMDALGAIGLGAVPALAQTVRNGPGNAPIRAAIVLGSIGPDAKDATAALEEALKKAPEDRRARWEEILATIDPSRTGGAPAEPETSGAGPIKVVLPENTIAPPADNADWPQFHGPGRDSLCRETGLLQQWPDGGPTLLWKLEGLGRGYSTISIAGGRIFTMGDRKDGQEPESQFVIAYDLATRQELWATRVGEPFTDGPRCTPTVDGELLYALGTDGGLVCLETDTGGVRFKKSLPDDFGGQMMSGWKYSESPLVDGDRLICTPGADDAAIVALDKQTGSLVWKTALPDIGSRGKDGAAYASAVVAEIRGVRQCVQLLGRGVVGVDAASGRFLWGYNRIANNVANIPTPVVCGNYVFVANGYQAGSALLEITRDGDAFEAKEIYVVRAREFENHHGGVVLVGDHIYAGSGQNRGEPACLDLATGKVAWKVKPLARGSASVLYADGHLVFRYDRGLVALVEASPEGFRLKGSFQPETGDGPAWPHPVIHDGKLYLRHGDLLLCYDVKP